MASVARPRKYHRTSLACTECRKRKLRCDGDRPSCTSCIKAGLTCNFEQIRCNDHRRGTAKNVRPALSVSGSSRTSDSNITNDSALLLRIKALEDRLASMPGVGLPGDATHEHRPSLRPLLPLALTRDEPEDVMKESESQGPTLTQDVYATAMQVVPQQFTVDELATSTFDEKPRSTIQFFGPTSNHALFRKLSAIFAHSLPQLYSQPYAVTTESITYHHTDAAATAKIEYRPPQQVTDMLSTTARVIPASGHALFLIDHFFTSIGLVLPFVQRLQVLEQWQHLHQIGHLQCRKSSLILLNMIWAHASHSLHHDRDAQNFSLRASHLLNAQDLVIADVEMLQSLLLFVDYQQNHQRSISSWKTHAQAVGIAYELGLHATETKLDVGSVENILHKSIWHTLIYYDRLLGVNLGRPFLIPQQLGVMTDASRDNNQISNPELGMNVHIPRLSLAYLCDLTTLSTVFASIVELLYDYKPPDVSIHEILSRRLQALGRLEYWRRNLTLTCSILSVSPTSPPSTEDELARVQILISIHYYRALLLLNCPAIILVLSHCSKDLEDQSEYELLSESLLPIVKTDLLAAQSLCEIIAGISDPQHSFLDLNAAWFISNYSMFTIALHLFAILLVCKHNQDSITGITAIEIRHSLDKSLRVLETLQRTSLMTLKARRCIMAFLEVLDSCDSKQSIEWLMAGGVQTKTLSDWMNNPTLLPDSVFDGLEGISNDHPADYDHGHLYFPDFSLLR